MLGESGLMITRGSLKIGKINITTDRNAIESSFVFLSRIGTHVMYILNLI